MTLEGTGRGRLVPGGRVWTGVLLVAAGLQAGAAAAACSGSRSTANPSDAGSAEADARSSDARLDVATDTGTDVRSDVAPVGAPTLVALSVASLAPADGATPLSLHPAFAPDVFDYYVPCGAGKNALRVSMTASRDADSLLLQPTPSPSRPAQTLDVTVVENDAIVAAATSGTATTEYWVRCLPHDFPPIRWDLHGGVGSPTPGYYLLGSLFPLTMSGYAMILDGHGVPVWYSRPGPIGQGISDVDTLEPGTVSFFRVINNPPIAKFSVVELAPLGTTSLGPASAVTDQHELQRLANGDFLVISTPLVSGVDLTGLKVALYDGGAETLSGPHVIVTCDLVEFQPGGMVTWTWHAASHFDAVKDSVDPIVFFQGSTIIDPFHCDSVDEDPGTGNLLVSARELGAVFVIEKSTGDVLWKMGGSIPSSGTTTYVPVASPFSGQHDARFQPGWSSSCRGGHGRISLFDDHSFSDGGAARGVVYDVTVGAPDSGMTGCDGGVDASAPGSATVAWQYQGASPSNATGSFRITKDGSRVIDWGISLTTDLVFSEVDVQGHDLLDVYFLDGNISYRTIKVPLTTFDLPTLRQAAGVQ